MTNLAAVKHELAEYDPDVVHGTVLDRAEVDRQIELYRTRTAEERRGILGLQPGREAVILAGTCVVRTVLAKLVASRSPSATAACGTACSSSDSGRSAEFRAVPARVALGVRE